MAGEEQLFNISLEDEMKDVFYFQQISHEKDKFIFKVPWGGAIVRNSSTNGKLLQFRTVKEYEVYKKENNKTLWLLLPLKVFRHSNTLFGVYCCPECETMAGTDQLSIDQDPRQILSRLCVHSKVCSTILDDWRDIWDIDVSPQDQVAKIICNEDITVHEFQVQTKESTLLAGIRTKDEVALLYTVTSRQDTHICSSCVTRKCPHANRYKRETAEEELPREFESGVNRDEDQMMDTTEEQESSEQTDRVTESGTDEDAMVGQAETDKHKNYWVTSLLTITE